MIKMSNMYIIQNTDGCNKIITHLSNNNFTIQKPDNNDLKMWSFECPTTELGASLSFKRY